MGQGFFFFNNAHCCTLTGGVVGVGEQGKRGPPDLSSNPNNPLQGLSCNVCGVLGPCEVFRNV